MVAMRFSASRIGTWMDCSLQAHLKYDLSLQPPRNNAKAVFGSAIHVALEHYNLHGNVNSAIRMFRDLWANPEKLGSPVETLWWPKMTSFKSLDQRGVDLLRRFDEQCQWDKRTVIATEHRFLVPFGKYELTGAVDLLEIRRSGTGNDLLRVCDYKTASRRPNMAELALNIQFTVYMWAVAQREFWVGAVTADGSPDPDFPPIPNGEWAYEMYKDMPRRAIWVHLWEHKELDAGPRDDAEFARLYKVVEEIDKADKAQIHVPRIGEACLLCDYRAECTMGVHIPTATELAELDDAWL
jgi:hypothetical protein